MKVAFKSHAGVWIANPDALNFLDMHIRVASSAEAETLFQDLGTLERLTGSGLLDRRHAGKQVRIIQARFDRLVNRSSLFSRDADRFAADIASRRRADGWTDTEVEAVAEALAPLIFHELLSGRGLDAMLPEFVRMTSGSPGRAYVRLRLYAATGATHPDAEDADVVYLLQPDGSVEKLTLDSVEPEVLS